MHIRFFWPFKSIVSHKHRGTLSNNQDTMLCMVQLVIWDRSADDVASSINEFHSSQMPLSSSCVASCVRSSMTVQTWKATMNRQRTRMTNAMRSRQ